MRNDFALAERMIRELSDRTPTSDGRADERTTAPFPGAVALEGNPQPWDDDGLDLLETLTSRRSILGYRDAPMSMNPLFAGLLAVLEEDARDWPEMAPACPLEAFLFALQPDDVEPGIYRVSLAGVERVGDLPETHHEIGIQQEFTSGGAVLSISADLDAADRWGAHGYRLAMTRATSAVYAFHLQCVAHGLGGTVFAGFVPSAVRRSLMSDGVGRAHLFAVTVGHPRTKSTAAAGA